MAEDTNPALQGLSFADPRVAMRARDVFRKIANTEAQNAVGTNPNVGRVMNVDIARLRASVWFTGDDGPIEVGIFPGSIPKDLGNYRTTTLVETSTIGTGGLVYVENFRGQPYITRILSGGEYTLNQQVAGLTHLTFNATRQGTVIGAPVTDIYERHVNIKLDAPDLAVGSAMLVGPWAGANFGSQIDGIIEIVISYSRNCRKYQFSVSDAMIVDLEGDEFNKSFWMRVLPETNLSRNPDAELAIDVALVKTGIRAPIEFWVRLVPVQSTAAATTYTMSVKTYGSAFNVGDPATGRIIAIKQATADPLQGWIGFNNAGHAWTEADENVAFPIGTYYQNGEWSSGSYRSAPPRAANDLRPLWRATGQWIWGTDNKLLWEGDIVFTGIGAHYNIIPGGALTVGFPNPTGFIPVLPSDTGTFGTQIRATTGGILLNPGETLYYGLCPGMGTGGVTSWMDVRNTFFIVDSKTYASSVHAYALPEWAIPIASRAWTANGERQEINICNHSVQAELDDRTKYIEASYTSSHSGIVGGDETETLILASFKYRKKTAYDIFWKASQVSSFDSAIMWRLRKGATAAGTLLTEFYRIPIVVSSTTATNQATGRCFIVNDTTSDITAQLCITGQSNVAAANTWTRTSSATTPSILRADECGPSSKYSAWPHLT